jgi:lipopolysaccharide export system protein LptA
MKKYLTIFCIISLIIIILDTYMTNLYAMKNENEPSKNTSIQSKKTDQTTKEDNQNPLEVYSDNALELFQNKKLIIARGHAKAIRNNLTVKGDVLLAHYRNKINKNTDSQPSELPINSNTKENNSESDNEVWRIEADKNVSIASTNQTAFGDHADYNIDDGVVVLTGKNLKMVSPKATITARDTLEYWDFRHQAVARGEAVAIRDTKRIQADVLVADFAENASQQMEIQIAHGYGHVVLTTPTEIVTGDKADYQVKTGLVVITGIVKMTRTGGLQLNGGYAVINLDSGISHLYPSAPGKSNNEQVKGMFVRQNTTNRDKVPDTAHPLAPTPYTGQ